VYNYDNTACIKWTNNIIGSRESAKHIKIRKHFTVRNGHMILRKIATTSQLVDIMTKGVKLPQWEICIKGLLGQPLEPSWLRRGGITNCTSSYSMAEFGYSG